MKRFSFILIALATACISTIAFSQNVMLNILTQKSGMVRKGNTIFLEITVNNTDPTVHVGIYKIKTQVSVPIGIASISNDGHVLPTGWTITSNDGAAITLSNGKDMIAATDARTILIAIRGEKIGGPSTISCQLSFSDGISPGTSPGILPGENPADNRSTSTIKVIK